MNVLPLHNGGARLSAGRSVSSVVPGGSSGVVTDAFVDLTRAQEVWWFVYLLAFFFFLLDGICCVLFF